MFLSFLRVEYVARLPYKEILWKIPLLIVTWQ